MNNKKLQQHLNKALQQAPIDLLDSIKSQQVNKLEMHDHVTRQQNSRGIQKQWKPILALGSVAALFFIVVLGWLQAPAVDSIVYLDVNPSFEIVVDRNERVVNLQSKTEDGQMLVEEIDYKNKDLSVVTEELLNEMVIKGFLDVSHRFLLISVLNDDVEKAKAQIAYLNTNIHDYLEARHVKPIVLRQSITKSNTIAEYAEQYNISIGKMTFVRNLIILNPDFEVEELITLSLEDLVCLSAQTKLDIKSIIDVDDEIDKYYAEEQQVPEDEGDQDQEESEDESHEDREEPEDESHEDQQEPEDEDTAINEEPSSDILIGRDKAIEIALSLTDGGRVVEFEADIDDGHHIYEIEIEKNHKEYDIELDARTGKVLEFESDDDEDGAAGQLIGRERAMEIALDKTEGGRIVEFELDEDDGQYIYEIEIIKDGIEYEVEIDGYSGKIIEFEEDD